MLFLLYIYAKYLQYVHIYIFTNLLIFISRRALAWEGDYEMMPVCACVS